jgi:hypothetical protein
MNSFKYLLIVLMGLFIYSSACDRKQEKSDNLISGESSKVWKTVKEIDEHGKNEKLTEVEKNEVIQFYSDGHFIIKSGKLSNEGKWTYDHAGQNLSLTFGGANFTEYFTVLELEKDKMKLKGRDGNTLVMKSERG